MFELNLHDRVAEVTLCRPPVNAISEAWGEAFVALLDELDARDDWSVLHLRSNQKVFAAGADLAQIQSWIAAAQPDARAVGLHRPAAGGVPKARSRSRASRWPRSAAPRSAAGWSWRCLRPAHRRRRREDRPARSRHRADPGARRHAAAHAARRPRHRGAPDPGRRARRRRHRARARHRAVDGAPRRAVAGRGRARRARASPACRCRR